MHRKRCSMPRGPSTDRCLATTGRPRPRSQQQERPQRRPVPPSWWVRASCVVWLVAASFCRLDPVAAQWDADAPVREVPPEIDVSPQPTPPPRRPTRRPTTPPTAAPTAAASTASPSRGAATLSPSTTSPMTTTGPTMTMSPMTTMGPTMTISPMTTTGPTMTTSPMTTMGPTMSTPPPSFAPTMSTPPPTPVPSPAPTTAPSSAPTTPPTTPQPTRASVAVPLDFAATIQAPTDTPPQPLADALERAWEDYLTTRLPAMSLTDDTGRFQAVELRVAYRERRRARQGLRRRVQATLAWVMEAQGVADFVVSDTANETDFVATTQQSIGETLVTREGLQEAMDLAETDATVTSVTWRPSAVTTEPSASNKPSTRQVAIGFGLLAVTLLALLVTARVLYQKHAQEQKQKRLAELRQAKLARMGPASVGRAAAAPAVNNFPILQPLPTAREGDSSSDEGSHYPGLDSETDEDADSDPFAKELEEAVSIDRMAWMELLQQQEPTRAASRDMEAEPESYAHSKAAPSQSLSPRLDQEERVNMGVLGLVTRAHPGNSVGGEQPQQEPDNIQRISSFPYGDENDTSFMHHDDVELHLNDGTDWREANVTLNVIPRRGGGGGSTDERGFEPYGDNAHRRANQSPSKTQFIVQPAETSTYDPDRANPPEASIGSRQFDENLGLERSWRGTGRYDTPIFQSRDFDELLNDLSSDDSDDVIDPGLMIREVSRLSDFVRRYGQKRELERSMRDELDTNIPVAPEPNPLLERLGSSRYSSSRQPPDPSADSPAHRSISNKATENSPTHANTNNTQFSFLRQAADYLTSDRTSTLMRSDSVENDEEEAGRLGIGRFRVQKPPNHLLSLRPSGSSEAYHGPASVTPNGSEDSDMEPGAAPKSTGHRPGPDTAVGQTPPHLAPTKGQETGPKGPPALPNMSTRTSLFPVLPPKPSSPSSAQAIQRMGSQSRPMGAGRFGAGSSVVKPVKGLAAMPVAGSTADAQPPPSKPGLTPPSQTSPRNQNSKINNIINMFESKPKNAVRPLSESWQYNGASSLNR